MSAYGLGAGTLGMASEQAKFGGRAYDVTISPSAVSAAQYSVQTFTVTGLRTDDLVSVQKPTDQSGLEIANAFVSAADTLSIRFANRTMSEITPTASETYKVVAHKVAAV